MIGMLLVAGDCRFAFNRDGKTAQDCLFELIRVQVKTKQSVHDAAEARFESIYNEEVGLRDSHGGPSAACALPGDAAPAAWREWPRSAGAA